MNLRSAPVSLLAGAARCPVRAFFSLSCQWEETPDYTICKQLSYHLGTPLSFETIWSEICGVSPYIAEENSPFLRNCISRCDEHTWRAASGNDMKVRSEKYGVHGTIDRIFSSAPFFSVIRPVSPPVAGIFSQDRIRVTAYSLCLSEMLGKNITGGTVEYIPGGESRYCEIQPGDMRKFYSARRIIQNLEAGIIPVKPLNAPCKSCLFQERCDPGPKRLSDLL
jgi:CRISPR-associated exonuclease Cas4